MKHYTDAFLLGASLSIEGLTSSSASISWQGTLSMCPLIDFFFVEYALVNLEQCEIQSGDIHTRISTSETSITLHNLRAGSTYEVYVTSQTSSGASSRLYETFTTFESGINYDVFILYSYLLKTISPFLPVYHVLFNTLF